MASTRAAGDRADVSFGDIETGGLRDFLVADRFVDQLCVFIHVPKTAGSSLSAELARMRAPYHNIHRRYFHGGDTVTFSSLEEEIDTIIDSGALAAARSCSGHFTWDQAAPIRAARPDARFFTFLRDPVQRVISDYRYSRTPTHPTYRETIARFPTIESYVEARETQDKMARFLLPGDVRDRDAIEAFLTSRYAFVGLLEMYPLSFNILSRLLGENLLPSEHRRRTENTGDNEVADTPELRAFILDHNKRDRDLYVAAHRRLLAIRDEWRTLRAHEMVDDQ
ncbi:sulfotransferase family 2 domain-containing protein [Sphingomonas sp. NBWT7]|uniref:sulfotransferase family 2 domain-containing protein n=1 Tax=Sphingomonas sp. NBWT7 TaxID=2596913 RepID=UPI0016267CE4|nr:sulfotransferase family 2 domain-containing protein [Sphingomonas sp. NBWT7]